MAPRHVILYSYSPTSRKYEAYNALVIGSAQREGDKELQLNLVHFRHDDLPAHHALSGVDWADTIDRTLDVPHKSDQEKQSFYYVEDDKPSKDDKKLKAFIMDNFKSETGNETATDCAIRLLTKAKAAKAPKQEKEAEKTEK